MLRSDSQLSCGEPHLLRQGHTLKLEALPLDWTRCKLVTLPPKPREDDGGEDAPF